MNIARPWLLAGALALAGCKGDAGTEQTGDANPGDDQDQTHAGPVHTPEVAAAIGRGHDLFFAKAMCSTCHRVGDEGGMIVGPNLGVGDDMREPVAVRALSRGEAGRGEAGGAPVDPPTYIIDSILDPNAVVTPGYARGVMKSPDDIPIALSDDELVDLVAFLLATGATEAVDPAALARARARIPIARAAREQRRQAKP